MNFYKILLWSIAIYFIACNHETDVHQPPSWITSAKTKMIRELVKNGRTDQGEAIEKGIELVSAYWRPEDGDQETFEYFIRKHYCNDQTSRDQMFFRFQKNLEVLNGHMDRIVLTFRSQADLDSGPVLPFDELFAAYDPAAHVTADFFKNKLAFAVLLNFPLSSPQHSAEISEGWSRRQWAEQRLASTFIKRLPPEISLKISQVGAQSEQYIANYNICMDHLLTKSGSRLFPSGLCLLSHWNLRDEIRAQYAGGPNALEKQRMIQKVMERIIDQSIPEAVINNPGLDWFPYSNKVIPASVKDSTTRLTETPDVSGKPEPDTRYVMLRKNFLSQKAADPYWPAFPSYIKRKFEYNREIGEERVSGLFQEILLSTSFKKVAELIKKNLGRDLEPFDIWYNGFRPRSAYTEELLDKIVARKYPDARAFEKDIPRILLQLGFSKRRVAEIAPLIVVDQARGSGHAWGPRMFGDRAHLRTRIGPDGMNYKGYNIAIHELGHNVEQVISMNNIDYTLLAGVPNNAFTEAMAFIFQTRDLELLGLGNKDPKSDAMKALNDFWATCEISAVALVDNAVWHWMYKNPDATPQALKQATLSISRKIWNDYFAPVFTIRDISLLAVYSHMISYPLYLSDYPLGHVIACQIENRVRQEGLVGPVFDRMARIGNINPDLWMKEVTGSRISAQTLFHETEEAIHMLENN